MLPIDGFFKNQDRTRNFKKIFWKITFFPKTLALRFCSLVFLDPFVPYIMKIWIFLMAPNFSNRRPSDQPCQDMKTFRGPTPECYIFSETSHDPKLKSQIRCKILQIFMQPIFFQPHLTLPFTLTINPKPPTPFTPIPFTPTHAIYFGCDFIDTSLVWLHILRNDWVDLHSKKERE